MSNIIKKFLFIVVLFVFFFEPLTAGSKEDNAQKNLLPPPLFSYFQQKKIEYYKLEYEAKISVLNKELLLKKKLFEEELAKSNDKVDIYLLEKIADDIKYLSSAIEQMWIDFELNVRNAMTFEQYSSMKLFEAQPVNPENKK